MVSTEGWAFFAFFSWAEGEGRGKREALCCFFLLLFWGFFGWLVGWVEFGLVFFVSNSLLVSLLTLLVFTLDTYSFPSITSSTMQYLLFLRRRF